MKKNLRRFLVALLVLALIPFASLAESTSGDGATADTAPAATNAAGLPYVLDYFADTPLDVSLYQGKALFLNFFTGWCYYCMQEMPEIKQIYDTYDPNDVAIVLVHVWSGEDATDSAAVVEQYGLQELNLIEDDQLVLADMIGLTGFPTSLFIDKDGYLNAYQPGALTYDSMASALEGMGVGKRADAAGDTLQTDVDADTEVKQ
jgi:thiol-disulfide isomerase/thioredoxin